jgi:hypothetical protein
MMTARGQKATSAVALFLVFAISQVYVQANLLTKKAGATNAPTASAPIAGKLATRKDQPIKLNGSTVNGGATILPGAQLETPALIGATVQLGKLGKLDLAPKTQLTIAFGDNNVAVALTTGAVVLTTNPGVDGSVTTDAGTRKTDSKKRDAIAVQAGGAAAGDEGAGAEGMMSGLSGGGARTLGVVILSGAVAAAVFIPCRGGNNPSPGRPDDCEHFLFH